MKWSWVAVGVLVVASALAVLGWHARPQPAIPTTPVAAAVVAFPVRAPATIEPAALRKVADALSGSVELERDAAFLYVTAWQVRCHPDVGHAIARLATRVGLPTMQAAGQLLSTQPDVAHTLYDLVRAATQTAPCDALLQEWQVGSYSIRLAPKVYVDRFPDSYFDPSQTAAATTRPLYLDVDSACLSLAYRALPLDPEVPWQCASSRREARRQIVQSLCPADAGDEAAQQRLAEAVHGLKRAMPDLCQ